MKKLNELNAYILRLLHKKPQKTLDTDSSLMRDTDMPSDTDFDFPERVGEDLESFADEQSHDATQHAPSEPSVFSGLNAIFAVVLIVSLVGFSGTNWFVHKHLTQLATNVADLQSKIVAMTADRDAREQHMQTRIAELDDSFRQVRLKLGQQSGDDGLVALELRLVEAEKEISRLRLVMHSTTKHQRVRRVKRTVREVRHAPVLATHTIAPSPPPAASHPTPASKDSGQHWFVNLATRSDELAADRELKKIRKSGMMAGKHGVNMHGKKYWRLSVAGFSSREEAHAFIRNVAAKHGFPDAWVYQKSSR